jgi:hypothetical protein
MRDEVERSRKKKDAEKQRKQKESGRGGWGTSGVQNEWSMNLWANGGKGNKCVGLRKENKEKGDAFFMGGE